MLEQIDLTQTISKPDFKHRVAELAPQLRELQVRHCRAGVPTILLFEGWDCAGKGESIATLAEILDPRNFKMYPIFEPSAEEARYPFLHRFWTRTPARGDIAIFDRSWYQRVLTERVDRHVKKHEWKQAYDQITRFERQLADDGTRIIKFFLHISKKEQHRRFKAFEADPHESWRVRKEDWRHHEHYNEFVEAAEEMFLRTDSPHAPWHIIAAEDLRHARLRVMEIIVEAMREDRHRIEANPPRRPSQTNPMPPPPESFRRNGAATILDRVDLSQSVGEKEYKRELRALQTQLRHLSLELFNRNIPSIILYQGWDAAGKGGNIKRLTARLDPRIYDAHGISKPNSEENAHHYLWRFWKRLPKDGHIAIFDRSWYGRVLVERIEGFCSEEEWRRAFQEINEFEDQLLQHGCNIIKFFIHIDKDEQERRFNARLETPSKQWKIGKEDWRNREKWDRYEIATEEMIQRTSTPGAPWTIIPGNDKRHARLAALRAVIAKFESRLRDLED